MITVNVSKFSPYNVTDACAVWNTLSSNLLFTTAKQVGIQFVCTDFVAYECLHKPRQSATSSEVELRERLITARSNGDFNSWPLDVADLQSVQILSNRKRLGKGELSSAAFAYKIRQALLTDDQGARQLVKKVLPEVTVQTTPHLLGWLVYCGYISGVMENTVIVEHECVLRDHSATNSNNIRPPITITRGHLFR